MPVAVAGGEATAGQACLEAAGRRASFKGGSKLGMKIDTGKARKALYGITMGMTNQELAQYSGYGINTIRSIRKNPGRYKKVLQEQAKKEDEQRRKREYVSTFKEEFALEWKETTNWIKKYAGWKK